MTIVVTGGAGFIGSHLVERLLKEGHTVYIVDNFHPFYDPKEKERNIEEVLKNPNCTLFKIDITDRAALDALPQGIDVVVHLAARAGVRPSLEDPAGYELTNVIGTKNMLDFARARGVKQFVFGSSSSVYGVNPNVPWREEDTELQPISPYASTKIAGEKLCKEYSSNMRVVALRFFTVYGPRQRPDLAIRKFTTLILEGKPIPFFGNGDTRRDYTNVADIVDGIVAAISYTASQYEIINLGNNHTVSLTELIAILENATGKKATLDHKPAQTGDVPQTWADITKAGRILGYAPKIPFEQGISEFVSWYRERYP